MKEIISSYPNIYYKSKHVRFKGYDICCCACDCDCILDSVRLKKGETCPLCKNGNHKTPNYRMELRKDE